MTPDDEAELHRLTAILRSVSERLESPSESDAVRRAAVALILTFLRSGRVEIDEWLHQIETPTEESLTSGALFHLSDPDFIASQLRRYPALRDRIETGDFSPQSMGDLLQSALQELGRRHEAGNVTPIRRPDPSDDPES